MLRKCIFKINILFSKTINSSNNNIYKTIIMYNPNGEYLGQVYQSQWQTQDFSIVGQSHIREATV